MGNKKNKNVMSKVITFSRFFPSYHPRKGEPTFFVEKLWQSIYMDNVGSPEFEKLDKYIFDVITHDKYEPKHHTIRAGNRWKVGDKFSPRVWSDKPYRSKQITIAPDIEIKKVWHIEIYGLTVLVNDVPINNLTHQHISQNDGLSYYDFKAWFNKLPFIGQIICWNKNITYDLPK